MFRRAIQAVLIAAAIGLGLIGAAHAQSGSTFPQLILNAPNAVVPCTANDFFPLIQFGGTTKIPCNQVGGGGGGGGSGFPITIGSTAIAASSTNPVLAGLTLTTPTINGGTLAGTFAGTPTFGNITVSNCTGCGLPITIGSTSIAAGSTTTTIAGLTLNAPSITGISAGTCANGLGLNASGAVIQISCSGGGGGGGTVTNVSTAAPLTGGPITISGTIGITGPSNLTTFGANVIPKGAGSSPFTASSLTDTGAGITCGSPTGGPQGSGTLNCTGLYVNGASVGSGNVSSVGLTSPGGIFSVSGTNPITGSGSFGYSLAGNSGGVPYFSSASALSSSGLLTANALIKGGGSGTAPSSSTVADAGSGVTVGSPTGGGQGAGTLNAAGLFVNGVAVSGGISGLTAGQAAIAGSPSTITSSVPATTTINGTTINLGGSGTVTAAANTLTGTTLATNVVTSSLTTVGTLIGGATGAGFTIALGSSTITGTLPAANMLPLPTSDVYYGVGGVPTATSYISLLNSPPGSIGTTTPVAIQVTQGTSPQNTLTEAGGNVAVNAALGQYFGWTITGADTLQNPTGLVSGEPQILDFRVVQDATGGRTLAFGTSYIGTVALNTAPNSITTFSAFCWTTTECDLSGGIAPTLPLVAGSGTGNSLTAPSEIFVCTTTCTVTPPLPTAGYQFCVTNDDGISTVITLGALGGSARYENTSRGSYGTAGTGTLTSGGALADQVCIVGRDSTHYITTSYVGAWTAS